MYFDSTPCQVCGAEVRLRAHDGQEPRAGRDPDGTVDVRECTNAECTTRGSESDTPEP